jgi:hypothetical protein
VQSSNAEAATLLADARSGSLQTEAQLRQELQEKNKQLLLLQSLLETQAESRPVTPPPPPQQQQQHHASDPVSPSKKDRAFMDTMFLSVLEQRDTLQDQVGCV